MKSFSRFSFLVTLLILRGTVFLVGQSSILQFHQFTTDEGLTQSTNEFLYQDRRRFTWIGSIAGLNRFDGNQVTTFVPSGQERCRVEGFITQSGFFEDDRERIWLTTDRSINCYDTQRNCFSQSYLNGDSTNIGRHYAVHLERSRFLWVEALGDLYRLDTRAEKPVFGPPVVEGCTLVRAVADTTAGGTVAAVYNALWAYGDGFELIDLAGERPVTTRYFAEIGSPASYTLRFTQVIDVPGPEVCLLSNKGLLFFNRAAPDDYRLFQFPEDFSTASHLAVVGEEIWMVNHGGTLARFALPLAKRGFLPERIRAYNLDEREFLNGIYRIFITPDGTLWIAVKNRGIYFANLKNKRFFSLFDRNELIPGTVTSLSAIDEDHHWATVRGGGGNEHVQIFASDGELLKQYPVPRYFSVDKAADGKIWGISERGLAGWVDETFDWDRHPLPVNGIDLYGIVAQGEHDLLIGSSVGIYRFEPREERFTLLTGHDRIAWRLYLDSRQRLWVDDLNGKLTVYRFDATTYTLTPLIEYPDVGLVNDFREDEDGRIWAATPYGLLRFTTENDSIRKRSVKLPPGVSPYLKALSIDHDELWLSTNEGVLHATIYADSLILERHYRFSDGLSSNEYSEGACLLTASGEPWFGSTRGVDRMYEQNIADTPGVVLQQLWINNQTTPWTDARGYTVASRQVLELPYDQNTLSLKFAALEYTNPKANRIKVSLNSGYRSDSTIVSSDELIHYTNLSPGNYEITYTARNGEGVWNDRPRIFALIIHPPWYQTLWFKMLASFMILAVILTVVVLYYRYQLRMKDLELDRVKILSAERQRIAADMHDHLNTELAHMRMKSLRAARKEDVRELKDSLLEVSNVSKFLVYEIKDLIWTLKAKGGSLEGLIVKIVENVNKFMEAAEIKRIIKRPEQLPQLKISSTARYNLNYTIKELLVNIERYAEADEVLLDISITVERLVIMVADNGKGFDFEEAKERSNGIGNCIRRIAALNGTIQWNNQAPSGTLVIITVGLADLK